MTGYTFPQLIDFTRTSAATFVNSSGNIASTPQSRNLLTFTNEFANAAWTKTNTTITANSAAAPDGTMTADTLTAGAGAGSGQQIYQALTTIGAGSFVYSVYVKQGSGATDSNRFVVFNQTASLTFASITVNYSSGVVTQTVGTGATMTAVGNGWWRVVIPFTSTATLGDSIRFFVGSSGSVETPGEFIYAWGAQVESGSAATDYTRNFGGLFPPRFDYDPVTRAPRGLLIEEQRTNLLRRSEEFDNAAWQKNNGTIAADATTAPDGTLSADRFVENTSNTSHFVLQSATTTAASHTFSVYAKAAGRTFVLVYHDQSNSGAVFNLSNGAITTPSGIPLSTASVTNAGNGWYRCAITVTATAASNGFRVQLGDTATNYVYTGDGTSGVFIWGAQLEAGAFATSYIPTVASQVSRSADVAGINAPNFASWYNQSSGTFVVSASCPTIASAANIFTVDDGTTQERIRLLTDVTDPKMIVTDGNVTQANLDAGAVTANTAFNFAGAYSLNDFAVSVGGGAAVTDAAGTIPTVTTARLGADSVGNYLNGHIRSIRYYPTKLSNAQLQALTA